MRWLLALCLLMSAAAARAAGPCEPCQIPAGTYHAAAPPDWNGKDKLRLLIFLHGYRGKGLDITGDPNIAGVANRLGFLLIAPDGEAGSWGHVGSPHRVRDDVAFVTAVLDDVQARWPIDSSAVVAGGFSQGASMVWDLACYAAPRFTAFIPFAGGFWEPLPDACVSGPVTLRHTHGTHDSMVPMQGRAILHGAFRQGDILQGFARWRAEDACRAMPDRTVREGDLICSEWTACGSGHRLAMCLHSGDHAMIAPWLDASLRWAIAAAP